MDIRNTDIDNIITYLTRKAYKPEQIIQILELATTAIKFQNNMYQDVKFNDLQNEVLIKEISNDEIK